MIKLWKQEERHGNSHFDTHKLIKQLETTGFSMEQAEAVVATVLQGQDAANGISKKDLQIELAPLRADLTLIKWTIGILIAGVASLVLKTFF